MRAHRELRKVDRQRDQKKEDAEKVWRSKVAVLTTSSPPALSIGEIKALLFVLPGYLSLAPYAEDATALLSYIQQLRRELSMRTGPPELVSE